MIRDGPNTIPMLHWSSTLQATTIDIYESSVTHIYMSPEKAHKRVYCTAQLTWKRRPHICEPVSVPVSMTLTSGGSQWGLLHYRGADPYLLTTTDT